MADIVGIRTDGRRSDEPDGLAQQRQAVWHGSGLPPLVPLTRHSVSAPAATRVRAAANGVDPLAWLTDVLELIVSGRTKAHEMNTLLPWHWAAAQVQTPTSLAA